MNKIQVARKLDRLATNVAKRGIFVVNKVNNVFVVQDHIRGNIVINDIPLRNVADYLCKCKNKQKEPSEVVGKKLRDSMKLYFKFANDIMFYKYTLKSTKDPIKYDMTEARLDDASSRLWHIREELQQYN